MESCGQKREEEWESCMQKRLSQHWLEMEFLKKNQGINQFHNGVYEMEAEWQGRLIFQFLRGYEFGEYHEFFVWQEHVQA